MSHTPLCLRILRPHLYIWRLCGIWPQPTDPWAYTIYSLVAFLVTSLIFNATLLLSLVQHHSVDDTVECLLPATTTVMTTVKIIMHLVNQQRFRRMFVTMSDLETQLGIDGRQNSDRCTEICASAERRSRNLFGMTSFIAYSAIVLACVTALLRDAHRLMWPAWFPLSWEQSGLLYYGLVAFQFVCNIFIGIMYTTMNTYAPVLFIILAAYLGVLGDRLQNIGGADPAPSEQLRLAHDQHKVCIRIADELNKLFGLHYAIHFGLSGLVICVTAFKLSTSQPTQNPSQFAFYCEYLLCMSMEIFMPCYFGSCLSVQSEQVGLQLYCGGWLRQSRRFARAMNLLVHRSQRSIRMWTYKRLLAIQLSTFVGILRFAYSLLSCIKGQ